MMIMTSKTTVDSFRELQSLISEIESNDADATELNLNYDYLDLDDDDVIFDDENDDFESAVFNECIEVLCTAISQNENIEKVQLFWDFMQHVTVENRKRLCQAIQNLSNLKYLSIFHGDEEFPISDLTILLGGSKSNTTGRHTSPLETIDLNNMVLTGSQYDFMQLCCTTKWCCQNLKEFLLYNVMFESQKELDPFMLNLCRLPVIQSVQVQTDFEEQLLSKQTVRAICLIPSLRNLSFESFCLSNEVATGVAEGLQSSNCQLERLALCGGDDLEYNSVLAIAKALRKNTVLQELRLAFDNSLCLLEFPDACSALVDALKANSSIKYLTLDGLSFIPDHSMANILRQNCSLETLCLTNNTIQSFVESAKALSDNKTLKSLHLNDNKLKTGTGVAISEALKRNSTLTVLNLSDNNLGEIACVKIANALPENQTLEALNLDNNLGNDNDDCIEINHDYRQMSCNVCGHNCEDEKNVNDTDEDRALSRIASAFIEALDHNSMIRSLSLHGGRSIPSDQANKLNFYLEMNSCGRHALLRNLDHLSHEQYLQVLGRVSQNFNQLYYMLRVKPELLPMVVSLAQQNNESNSLIRQRDSNDDDVELRHAKRTKLN